MRADGKTMRSELDYVKQFIRNNFGEYAVGDALVILKELSTKEINLNEVCGQIKFFMNSSQRLQLFHYLAGIAAADGSVAEAELSTPFSEIRISNLIEHILGFRAPPVLL